MKTIILGGQVTIEDVVSVARGQAPVSFADAYCDRVKRCRDHVETFSKQEEAIYGITTGLGDNCRKFVPEAERIIIQRNHILAHTCSVGEPINEECVRAIMFVMLAHFGCGHTGIRLETLELLRDMLNNNVIPRVPGHGSVGYVSLESHIGMVLIGEGQARYNGELLDGRQALGRAGLSPTILCAKEGLTIVSGTTSVTALTALALYDAVTIAQTTDIAAALTLEALKGNMMALDERLMNARPHPDQGMTAANIRAILKDSPIIEKYQGRRVQDALSLRSVPQLHGAVKKFIKCGLDVLETELNAAVDNPLLFEDADGSPVALMGSNADGSYAGMAADVLMIAVTDLCKMSTCRIDRMLNRLVSELPPFLNKNADYNNGLMMIQYTAAGLLGELRLLSHPSVVDNVTTCANQEDYVNMGYNAAKKAYDGMHLAKYICAIELMCGAQALDCHEGTTRPAAGTTAAYKLVREVLPAMDNDFPLEPYMEQVARQVLDRVYINGVEGAVGALRF